MAMPKKKEDIKPVVNNLNVDPVDGIDETKDAENIESDAPPTRPTITEIGDVERDKQLSSNKYTKENPYTGS